MGHSYTIGLRPFFQLKEPAHEILTLRGSDEEVSDTIQKAFKTLGGGSHGKKILLHWAEK